VRPVLTCACGCGKVFTPSNNRQRYAGRHRDREQNAPARTTLRRALRDFRALGKLDPDKQAVAASVLDSLGQETPVDLREVPMPARYEVGLDDEGDYD
jgi:hypothetical protein